MTTSVSIEAGIFVTDYASYNEALPFGKWFNFNDFNNGDELQEAINEYMKEGDRLYPLADGLPREEVMITDSSDIPDFLYSESGMDYDDVYKFLDLDEEDRAKVVYAFGYHGDVDEAFKNYEDVILYENTKETIWYLFEEYFPDASKAEEECHYLSIDYDAFVSEYFEEFEYDGESYLVSYDG